MDDLKRIDLKKSLSEMSQPEKKKIITQFIDLIKKDHSKIGAEKFKEILRSKLMLEEITKILE